MQTFHGEEQPARLGDRSTIFGFIRYIIQCTVNIATRLGVGKHYEHKVYLCWILVR